MFYFTDGFDYSILIEEEEWFEGEYTAMYGTGERNAQSKSFTKADPIENLKWAINWGKKVAKNVLENGYN